MLGVRARDIGDSQAVGDRLWRELQLRSEEHTSELQSLAYLVCRLLLEKKKRLKVITMQCIRRLSAPRGARPPRCCRRYSTEKNSSPAATGTSLPPSAISLRCLCTRAML